WQDVRYWLLNGILISIGAATLLTFGRRLEAWVSEVSSTTLGGLSPWVQIPLGLVVTDTFFWFAHRSFHKNAFLWQFHAVHHSLPQVDWLAGVRVHALDQTITRSFALLP